MRYTREENGKSVYSSCRVILLDGRWVSNPTEEMIAQAGWMPYESPQETIDEQPEDDSPSIEHRITDLENIVDTLI